ncbi:hypothetical protein D8674_037631 [Pyrus ussuriensis x Pyrus communis]|uniref:Uncharacterized protein n=1 Tax=Pyrus ussuriensis x Pyrus communis TaxID=2448454 RepID=A0A5N5GY45_9ROSA|nr:hypothetical protein D8674_037631 [Pyrus ussuriensis x Pyrus communis]
MTSPLGSPPPGPVVSMKWACLLARDLNRFNIELCLMIWWVIWIARNEKLWNGKILKPDVSTTSAISWWHDFQKTNSSSPRLRPNLSTLKWWKLPLGMFKVNVYGASETQQSQCCNS